jgi:gamma-glutamylcyclotransferase
MNYFAYGSNMLEERLKSPDRIPNAIFRAVASVNGYKLRFNKRGSDQSGKCNIVKTESELDMVFGVVYKVTDEEFRALDLVEGLGQGYHHESNFLVRSGDGSEILTLTYAADPNYIENDLLPYAWYHQLVVAGAAQHFLPEWYIASLRAIRVLQDPISNRSLLFSMFSYLI